MTAEEPSGERSEPEDKEVASETAAAPSAPTVPPAHTQAEDQTASTSIATSDDPVGAPTDPHGTVPEDEDETEGQPDGQTEIPVVQTTPPSIDLDEQQESEREGPATPENISTQRVFKKSSSNNKLTIYLGSRDIIIANRCSERVRGVVVVDPDYLRERRVFGQITLTFRYGREDEEVMGLKFCNEAIMCLAQLYPAHERAQTMPNTPLQDALLRRLGPNAHPFCMEMTPLAPPSVQLVPAKEYTGAPIGTSYDVRAYIADRPEEKVNRRSMVRMGIRVLHMAPGLPHPSPVPAAPAPAPTLNTLRPPHAAVDKPFLLSDGKVELEASLNKAVYNHGETVMVNVVVHNNSSRSVRRIKVFVVQHVDVCMFSNGKFKNVVALINSREQCPLGPGGSLKRVYSLSPEKGTTKNWIALEDSFARGGAPLASTVTCASSSPDDRNVFAIYVSYYVKVKLLVGAMGGELSVKLPFTLMHSSYDSDLPYLSSVTSGGAAEAEAEVGGSRRPSSVAMRKPDEDLAHTPSGKARMARQLRDADVILSCDDDNAAPMTRESA